jgi:hypothetical protein
MRYLLASLLLAALALAVLATAPARTIHGAGPLGQATATPTVTPTPTLTPTPLAAAGWDRVDHPDNVRCYWDTHDGRPFGGCVVVP